MKLEFKHFKILLVFFAWKEEDSSTKLMGTFVQII